MKSRVFQSSVHIHQMKEFEETERLSLEEPDLDQSLTHKLLTSIKTSLDDWSFGLNKDSQSQKCKFYMSCTDQLMPPM